MLKLETLCNNIKNFNPDINENLKKNEPEKYNLLIKLKYDLLKQDEKHQKLIKFLLN